MDEENMRRKTASSPPKMTKQVPSSPSTTNIKLAEAGLQGEDQEIQPLVDNQKAPFDAITTSDKKLGVDVNDAPATPYEFQRQVVKFILCFLGLQASYLTWGYMQELIMTTEFKPTKRVPNGLFPSAAFCVFSNRFLAVLVALISVRLRHGAFFANNKAPLLAFTPCAFSNTMSSWSQYKALQYVSFPVQTVFKSSKGKHVFDFYSIILMLKLVKNDIFS